jgi:LPXTG-motif cell wall-anchored protein
MNRLLITLVAVPLVVLGASTPVFATSDHNPAGNNGVVKINNEVTPDTIPQNHPHVSCSFSVEFYNYDKNNSYADVDFALQAPTNRDGDTIKVASGNVHPFIGEDAAGGGTDLDAREYYKLSFTGTPQAQQGYHVKVTVNAPGSQGSGKKQKVFWVQPCAENVAANKPQVLAASTENTSQKSSQQATELPNTGVSITSALGLGGIITAAGYAASILRRKLALR